MVERVCYNCGDEAVFRIETVEGGKLHEYLYYCGEHLHGGCKNAVFRDGSGGIVNLLSGAVYMTANDAYLAKNPTSNVSKRLKKLDNIGDEVSVLGFE